MFRKIAFFLVIAMLPCCLGGCGSDAASFDWIRKENLQVGDPVQRRFKRGHVFYAGTITRRDGRALHIKYDDGDEEDTTIAYVRLQQPRFD